MSEMGHDRTHAPQQRAYPFDNLIGAREQRRGISMVSAFAVLRLMTSSNLVGWITAAGLFALENPTGADAGLAISVGNAGPAAHQANGIERARASPREMNRPHRGGSEPAGSGRARHAVGEAASDSIRRAEQTRSSSLMLAHPGNFH